MSWQLTYPTQHLADLGQCLPVDSEKTDCLPPTVERFLSLQELR